MAEHEVHEVDSNAPWARVEEVRATKTRGGGPKRSGHVDLLGGLLECVCGRRLRSDGTFADGRHRKLHPSPCVDWGTRARLGEETWEQPVFAQVSQMSLDQRTFAEVVAALQSNERPISMEKARLERQIRSLAAENVEGRLDDEACIARKRQLRGEIATLERSARPGIDPHRVVDWMRALGATWQAIGVETEKAELLHAIYDRIVVKGEEIVSVRLTPEAQAHGMALALRQVGMARPTVSEFRT